MGSLEKVLLTNDAYAYYTVMDASLLPPSGVYNLDTNENGERSVLQFVDQGSGSYSVLLTTTETDNTTTTVNQVVTPSGTQTRTTVTAATNNLRFEESNGFTFLSVDGENILPLNNVETTTIADSMGIVYQGNQISILNGELLAMNITTLYYYDGFRFYRFEGMLTDPLDGPGTVYYNRVGNTALYSIDSSLNINLDQIIEALAMASTPPDPEIPSPSTITIIVPLPSTAPPTSPPATPTSPPATPTQPQPNPPTTEEPDEDCEVEETSRSRTSRRSSSSGSSRSDTGKSGKSGKSKGCSDTKSKSDSESGKSRSTRCKVDRDDTGKSKSRDKTSKSHSKTGKSKGGENDQSRKQRHHSKKDKNARRHERTKRQHESSKIGIDTESTGMTRDVGVERPSKHEHHEHHHHQLKTKEDSIGGSGDGSPMEPGKSSCDKEKSGKSKPSVENTKPLRRHDHSRTKPSTPHNHIM